MADRRNAGREIAWSLIAAIVFGTAFYAYLRHEIEPKHEPLAQQTAFETTPLAPELVAATAVVEGFASALAQRNYAAAYASMAQPYRDAVTLESFQRTCEASRILSGVQRGVLRSTRRIAVASGPYTEQGRGLLVTRVGSIDADFTFLVNGTDVRVLVLSLAGVPVLDGVSATPK